MNRVLSSLVMAISLTAAEGVAEQRGAPGSGGHGSSPFPSLYTVQYNDAVGTKETPSDQQLENAVSQAMQASPLTANSLIVVHVIKGEVTLEGAATSRLARREATRLAETVLGVTSIRNRLEVAGSETATAVPQ